MRHHIAAGLTGLALISLAACGKPAPGAGGSSSAAGAGAPAASGPVSVSAFPARKAGLWQQVIAMDGPATGPGFKVCIDAASDAKMSALRHTPGAKCSPAQMTRNLDGSIGVAETCDMGASGKSSTTGVIKGDFNSSYTVTMDSQISGSPMAQMNGEHKMTITATWLGPCAPGQKGGDMIFPGGMVRNTLDDQAGAGGGNAAPAAGN
jgi:hypothetical protein